MLLKAIEQPARAAPLAEACADREIVVVAVPSSAVAATIEACGDLAGKVLMDATNSVERINGAKTASQTSIAEEIAAMAPAARVVKAFNAIGANHYLDPSFGDVAADIFICGDDDDAKATVSTLATEIGFEVVDAGPLGNARLVEHLAVLWIYLAHHGGYGREIAFKLLQK